MKSKTEPTPAQIVKAHQYLYYVVSTPVISDYEYDQFCKRHQIDGIGGSDVASDYSAEEIELAKSFQK